MRKALSCVLAAALALSLVACGGSSAPAASTPAAAPSNSGSTGLADLEPVELAYAHMGSESAMVGQWGLLFKEKVEKASDGKITVTMFSNGAMGSDAEALESLLDNTVQIVASQPSPVVAFVPELGVFDLPCAFAAADAEKIKTALNDSEFSAVLDEKCAAAGFKCLGFSQGATFREFSSNNKVADLPDFKGQNMRVMDNAYQIQFWSALGCNTTPVPGSELYMSLQNGLVDSQENALDTMVLAGFSEVQKYVTMTNHSLYTNLMMMNDSYFNSLPEAYQKIINAAIAESIDEMSEKYAAADGEARKTLEESGLEFSEFGPEQYAKMVELAQPVYDSVREQIGNDIVDSLVKALA